MTTIVSNQKDPGRIERFAEDFEGIYFKQCALSMSGASTRSRFKECQFRDIRVDDCSVGHVIFEKCQFENVISTETVSTYEALFVECRFAGKVKNINFGAIPAPSPFFSPTRFAEDMIAIRNSQFSIDISATTEIEECAFVGDELAKKIRFRRGQGLLLSGKRLDLALGPTLKETEDFGLAVLLSGAVGFGALYELHFCPVPINCGDKLASYASIVRSLGVEVFEEAIC